jgi:hypothetical protein
MDGDDHLEFNPAAIMAATLAAPRESTVCIKAFEIFVRRVLSRARSEIAAPSISEVALALRPMSTTPQAREKNAAFSA